MLGGIARGVRRVRVDEVRKRDLPIRRIGLAKKIVTHGLGIAHRDVAMSERCVDLGEQHRGTHPVDLGADHLPVPGGRVRRVEHFAIAGCIARFDRELPRAIVRHLGEVQMPGREVAVVGGIQHRSSLDGFDSGAESGIVRLRLAVSNPTEAYSRNATVLWRNTCSSIRAYPSAAASAATCRNAAFACPRPRYGSNTAI